MKKKQKRFDTAGYIKKKNAEEKVAKTMREFKHGTLHSGSKQGPKVTDRKQAVAIGLAQAGLSKKKRKRA